MSGHADKRLPRPTPLTAEWWAACRDHKLLVQRCGACGTHQFYPRILCTACGAAGLDWVEATGRGTVETFTVVRHPVGRAYADEVPYAIALVRLEEGPVMMTALTGVDADAVGVGMAVQVAFEQWTDDITMPKFRPAAA